MRLKHLPSYCIIFLLIPAFNACSINKMAMRMVADTLSSGTTGTAFTGDDDPELVGDALPFALKLYESLISDMKDNPGLFLTAGSGFIMYANAWVQTPADMLPDTEFEKKKQMTSRARKLYNRGRGYVLQGMELKHAGFSASLENNTLQSQLSALKSDDVPFLYWIGAGWMAAYATDPFDVNLGIGAKKAVALMETALKIDESYGEGAIHEIFISYYGSLPQSMGGSEEKARQHFKRAVELSKGLKASPYVALASTISVKNQNLKEFVELLNKALAIDVNIQPSDRLANTIAQRKAQWLLDHREDRFLSDSK